jgi:hypothetical protein
VSGRAFGLQSCTLSGVGRHGRSLSRFSALLADPVAAIQLRESILETLNKALDTSSRVVTPVGRLRLEGLPTSAEAEDALRHLEAGDRSFKEILPPFLSR